MSDEVVKKEPVQIPEIFLNLARWIIYSLFFVAMLIPFDMNIWQRICGGLILGWFGASINEIILNLKK